MTALQVSAGLAVDGVTLEGDVNSDDAIGVAEAVFALREAARSGVAGRARAVLGPLAGATVKVFRLNDLENEIYSDVTDGEGYFDTRLLSEDLTKYVLVAVSGGEDVDADDDGEVDPTPTPNAGTIHALMTAAEFREGGFQVTALSDIVWQYTKNLVDEVDASGFRLRLDNLAKTFISEDIDGDGEVNANDALGFSPLNMDHRNRLNFDFQRLFAENAEGQSIVGCYHGDLPAALAGLLDEHFGLRLTLFPEPPVEYEKVVIDLTVLGEGKVASDKGGIDFDSDRENSDDNVVKAFLAQDPAEKLVLTAAPKPDTEILSWNGCDAVSEDKTQCVCVLADNRTVMATFGFKETVLKEGVHLVDLTGAQIAISPDQATMDVTAAIGDADMRAALAGIAAGAIVVGPTDGGFLRKVASVEKITDFNYVLTTEEAGLDEVIGQGTGVLTQQMTNGDLAVDETGGRRRSGAMQPESVETIEGVRFVPAGDPNDPVFRFRIGDERQGRALVDVSEEGQLSYPKDNPVVTVTGELALSLDLDTSISFRWGLPPLDSFKFVLDITANESLSVSFFEDYLEASISEEITLATMKFKSIKFSIGPVPVWVKPEVDIVLGITGRAGKISTSLMLEQKIKAGVVYNRGKNIDLIATFDSGWEFNPPRAEVEVEIEPFLSVKPGIYLYSATGPQLDLKGYLKLNGEPAESEFEPEICSAGFDLTAFRGVEASWEWDLEKFKKFGKWVENIEISGDIGKPLEEKIDSWNIGDTCGDIRLPRMKVNGLSVYESYPWKTDMLIEEQYVVSNTGDFDMPWEIEHKSNDVITVSPVSGTLGPEESATVNVTINTANITGLFNDLTTGVYVNKLKFKNLYDNRLFNGSTSRNIVVTEAPPPLVSPVMEQPVSAVSGSGEVNPGFAVLNWSYPDTETFYYITGYRVYMTETPDYLDTWREVCVVTNRDATKCMARDLQPETTYYFNVVADGGADDQSPLSEIVQLTTPESPVPPPGPAGIRVIDGDAQSVTVAWAPVDGAVAYNLYVAEESGVNKTNYLTLAGGEKIANAVSPFVKTGLAEGQNYYFVATALNEYGESVESDEVGYPEGSVGGESFTNSLGMTFNLIPAGTFTMGSPDTEMGSYDRERPQHEVTLSQDFYIMTTEVTQAQWEAVMGSNPSYFDSCGGDCPVETVSWNDIQEFITTLNALEGGNYRLPTETEWEYAARAGTTTAFYNGDITQEYSDPIDPNLDAIGWYWGNSGYTTHPVAQKQPNAWGLFDMSGNVWEWVQDWYGNYPENAVTDPVGPETASSRVIRGGSWHRYPQDCRSAYRGNVGPTHRNRNVGFRLALSPGR